MDEQLIITKCQAGSLDEYAKLYDKYLDKIYRFVFFRTGHRETAQDLTADIFMKAMSRIEAYDSQQAGFSTWLYTLARNTVIDHYRKQKPTADIDNYWNLRAKDDVEQAAAIQEKLEIAEKYLAGLTHEQREIVMLRVWDGLPYKQIAELVDKTEANCKMIFSRVVGKLKLEVIPAFIFGFLYCLDLIRSL